MEQPKIKYYIKLSIYQYSQISNDNQRNLLKNY